MAVINHVVTTTGSFSADFTTTLTVGDTYVVGTQTADSDAGGIITTARSGMSAVDTSVAGTYPVVYTAEDSADIGAVSSILETVIVVGVTNGVDTFISGNTDRFGNSTTASYAASVQNPPATPQQAGLFDENAFDPYELSNANKNV